MARRVCRLSYLYLLPLIAPGLAATAVFTALLAWGEFLFALLLGGPDTTTLPVYLAGFVGERTVEWGRDYVLGCLVHNPADDPIYARST